MIVLYMLRFVGFGVGVPGHALKLPGQAVLESLGVSWRWAGWRDRQYPGRDAKMTSIGAPMSPLPGAVCLGTVNASPGDQ